MDFKLTELKELLFDKKGIVPVAIALGLNFGLFFLFLIPFIPLFFMLGAGTEDAMGFGFLMMILGFIFVTLIAIPLGALIQAGEYGSLKQIIKDGDFKGKDYMRNMKKYFLSVLGYSILYGVAIMIISFPLAFIGGLFSALIPIVGFFIEMFLIFLILAVALFGSPIVYLAVIEGNKFDHVKKLYKERGKEFAIVCLIASFALALPFISFIASLAMFAFPAYVLILFYGGINSKGYIDADAEEVEVE